MKARSREEQNADRRTQSYGVDRGFFSFVLFLVFFFLVFFFFLFLRTGAKGLGRRELGTSLLLENLQRQREGEGVSDDP